MAEYSATINVNVEGEEQLRSLAQAFQKLRSEATTVSRRPMQARNDQQVQSEGIKVATAVGQDIGGVVGGVLGAPFRAVRTAAGMATSSLLNFAGPLAKVGATVVTGTTGLITAGVAIAAVGIPLFNLSVTYKLLQSSFGWATDAMEQQLTLAARTRRTFPGITSDMFSGAQSRVREQMSVSAALFGDSADTLLEQVTKRFTDYRMGRGLRGDRDIFARWGITPAQIRTFEALKGMQAGMGTPERMNINDWLFAFISRREALDRQIALAPEGSAQRTALVRRKGQLLDDSLKLFNQRFADLVGAMTTGDRETLERNMAASAALAASTYDTTQQSIDLKIELETTKSIFKSLKEGVAFDVMPKISGMMDDIREWLLRSDAEGVSMGEKIRDILSGMAVHAWQTMSSILADIDPDGVKGFIQVIRDEFHPEQTVTALREAIPTIRKLIGAISTIYGWITWKVPGLPGPKWLQRLQGKEVPEGPTPLKAAVTSMAPDWLTAHFPAIKKATEETAKETAVKVAAPRERRAAAPGEPARPPTRPAPGPETLPPAAEARRRAAKGKPPEPAEPERVPAGIRARAARAAAARRAAIIGPTAAAGPRPSRRAPVSAARPAGVGGGGGAAGGPIGRGTAIGTGGYGGGTAAGGGYGGAAARAVERGRMGGIAAGGPEAQAMATGEPIPQGVLSGAASAALSGGMGGVDRFLRSQGYSRPGAWCGAFAAAVVRSQGLQPPSNPQVAGNWKNWGMQIQGAPQPGDVAVVAGRSPRTGVEGRHVAFVESYNPQTGKVTLVGGNQGAVGARSTYDRGRLYIRRAPQSVAGLAGQTGQTLPSQAGAIAANEGMPQAMMVSGAAAMGPTGRRPQFAENIDQHISNVARQTGVDENMLRTFVNIESSGRPGTTTGSYKGLLQLSEQEFRKHGGTGSIYDPYQNLMAGARKLQIEQVEMSAKLGRPISPHELYLYHQQGPGGSMQHLQNPDQPAWLSMYQTAEGKRKGAGWAQRAIWGNVPRDVRGRFGNVNNITSGQFVELWREKYASKGGGAADTRVAVTPTEAPQAAVYTQIEGEPPPFQHPVLRTIDGGLGGGDISRQIKLVGGAKSRGEESWSRLDPELKSRLNAMYEDMPDSIKEQVGITSGWRSTQLQAQLYAAARDKRMVARPGRSRHEKGTAVDLAAGDMQGFGNSAAYKWMQQNKQKYGLEHLGQPGARGPWEPWHWQLKAGTEQVKIGGGIQSTEAKAALTAPSPTIGRARGVERARTAEDQVEKDDEEISKTKEAEDMKEELTKKPPKRDAIKEGTAAGEAAAKAFKEGTKDVKIPVKSLTKEETERDKDRGDREKAAA